MNARGAVAKSGEIATCLSPRCKASSWLCWKKSISPLIPNDGGAKHTNDKCCAIDSYSEMSWSLSDPIEFDSLRLKEKKKKRILREGWILTQFWSILTVIDLVCGQTWSVKVRSVLYWKTCPRIWRSQERESEGQTFHFRVDPSTEEGWSVENQTVSQTNLPLSLKISQYLPP